MIRTVCDACGREATFTNSIDIPLAVLDSELSTPDAEVLQGMSVIQFDLCNECAMQVAKAMHDWICKSQFQHGFTSEGRLS